MKQPWLFSPQNKPSHYFFSHLVMAATPPGGYLQAASSQHAAEVDVLYSDTNGCCRELAESPVAAAQYGQHIIFLLQPAYGKLKSFTCSP